jgi:putative DNA primase/helicase
MSVNEDMFEPLALGERSAAAAPACNRKAPDWIPVPVPDGLPLPDGRNRHNGVPFPWHSLGKPSECFWFRNAKGEVLGGECRFDLVEQDGKPGKTYRPLAYCRRDDGKVFDWRWQGLPKPYPLFNLPRLIGEHAKPVLITEGARKASAAAKLFPDFVPTAMLFGAEAPAKSDCAPLAARDNVIWPDHDDPGGEFVRKATAVLKSVGAVSLRVVKIPP